jgi:hypothetical protein
MGHARLVRHQEAIQLLPNVIGKTRGYLANLPIIHRAVEPSGSFPFRNVLIFDRINV